MLRILIEQDLQNVALNVNLLKKCVVLAFCLKQENLILREGNKKV